MFLTNILARAATFSTEPLITEDFYTLLTILLSKRSDRQK
jgi:hypothetical protein